LQQQLDAALAQVAALQQQLQHQGGAAAAAGGGGGGGTAAAADSASVFDTVSEALLQAENAQLQMSADVCS
jgi:hypothetical protein